MNDIKIFLDSGAFSAWSKGIDINIDEYIKFIKENEKYLEVYSVLDSIGDPELTFKNQRIMESQGLNPLPTFHYGEDKKYLINYINKYDYIALGGMVPVSNRDLVVWLDDLFMNYICDNNGLPKTRIHGFGMTSLKLMVRYPWYSVDSTSWVLTGRFGAVFVPKCKNGKYLYDENTWKVNVSNKSSQNKFEGKHFDTFSDLEKNQINKYFEEKGYQIGKSEFHIEDKTYQLKEGECWVGKEIEGKREVETIIEVGLCNDYRCRDELNIIYFLDLEKTIPEWPWSFKINKNFGLV